jgi:hypothetical protein
VSNSSTATWSISGEGAIADDLRRVSRYVDSQTPIAVTLGPPASSEDTFAVGAAALETTSERVVPLESAFEAIETVRDAVTSGETGRIYGCFTSVRLPRGSAPDDVVGSGLLPAVALTLDTVPGAVERVWARRASLFAADDAWFVTIRLRDETLLTIEAMASEPTGSGRSILVELTASERVLRAEPTRQAVIVEALDGSSRAAPWWEDLSERYLQLAARRASLPTSGDGTRLRAAWSALMTAAETGDPVTL